MAATGKLSASPITKKHIADLIAKGSGLYGIELNSNAGNAIEFIAAQVEFTAEVMAQGTKLTPRALSLLLVQKGLSLSDLSQNDYVKCSSAMASLAITLQIAVATTATGGPVGIIPALLLVADMYKTAKDCAPVAIKTHESVANKISSEVNRYDWSDAGIIYWISNIR